MKKSLGTFVIGCALLVPAPAFACATSVVFFGGRSSGGLWRRPAKAVDAATARRSNVELVAHRTVGDGIVVIIEHEHADLASSVLAAVESELALALRQLRELLSVPGVGSPAR